MSGDKKSLYDEWVDKVPDLQGKTVAITGTTSGTGFWTAVLAIRNNVSHLFLLNRKSERSTKALANLQSEVEKVNVTTKLYEIECDLMKFDSVKAAAQEINELCSNLGGLNVLANNAGIMMFPDDRTEDGFDVQMHTNHLSHFFLTKHLWPSFDLALEQGKEVRIVQHSAAIRFFFSGPQEKRFFQKSKKGDLGGDGPYTSVKRYFQTKVANCTFAFKLHEELKSRGYDVTKIKSLVAEPGIAKTELADNIVLQRSGIMGSLFSFGVWVNSMIFGLQSAEDGSVCLSHACFMDDVSSGDFYIPENFTRGKPKRSVHDGKLDQGKPSQERTILEAENQNICWEASEEVCGSFFEFSKNNI